MTPDVDQLIAFYKSPLGAVARERLRDAIQLLVGDIDNQRLLGLGFATPYMRKYLEQTERYFAFMPARQGASSWPREGPSHTVLCDPLEMPLTDSSMDTIILVHCLEHVEDDEELMRELWRIAAPNARIIIAFPRRHGFWAGVHTTPFGYGQAYSRSQIENLLKRFSFTPDGWQDCLHLPPFHYDRMLRSASMLEKGTKLFGPTFAGLSVVSARKELFPAIARRKRVEKTEKQTELAPQTARNHS